MLDWSISYDEVLGIRLVYYYHQESRTYFNCYGYDYSEAGMIKRDYWRIKMTIKMNTIAGIRIGDLLDISLFNVKAISWQLLEAGTLIISGPPSGGTGPGTGVGSDEPC